MKGFVAGLDAMCTGGGGVAAKHDRRREKRDVFVFAMKNTRLSEFAPIDLSSFLENYLNLI